MPEEETEEQIEEERRFRPNLGSTDLERARFQAMLYHSRRRRLGRLGAIPAPGEPLDE